MKHELSAELATVRDLALQAGEILLDSMGKEMRIEQKTATEFVTDVDRRVEDMLIGKIQKRFPGEAILAEESGASRGSGERTWYIDPLDGTTNYAHGYPFFSVSIACGDPAGLRFGAVFAPYLDELYLAEAGRGAMLERPVHGETRDLPKREPVSLDHALLATGFPYVRDETVDRNTGLVGDFLKARCHGVRRGGSAAIDLAHVAVGKLDGYWEWRLRPWDTAAGTLVAREAGALVTDFAGRDILIPVEHIVAAAPGLHDRMRTILAPVLAAAGGD
ncbi:MAG: inositol monophosphatase [Candidatus Krumholzibacteria bacterium]|nr:inositol monophosphatase [Candidatus Krumholzibacteria bacterium]